MIRVFVDGSCRRNGTKDARAGIGVVAYKVEAHTSTLMFKFGRLVTYETNNMAEYSAVFHALRELKNYGQEEIVVHSDSQLIVNQLLGTWELKDRRLVQLYSMIMQLITMVPFTNLNFKWIPRTENKEADEIAQSITDEKRDA